MSGVERPYRAGDDLGRAMRRLVRAAERLEETALEASGIPRAQGMALLAVSSMARPSMTMVARELDLAPSTATRLLDPLARRGLIDRGPDPEDRRVVVISLTTAGRRLARDLEAALERAYERLAALSADGGGRNRLHVAARDLLAALERARPQARGPKGQGRGPRPGPVSAGKRPAVAARRA